MVPWVLAETIVEVEVESGLHGRIHGGWKSYGFGMVPWGLAETRVGVEVENGLHKKITRIQ